MREDALSMLRSLVGHKVVAIRPGAEAEDVDFDLIFDDGRTLECYFTPGGGWSVGRDVDGDITPVFRQPAGAVAADQVSEAANHTTSDAYIPKEPSDAAARAALDIIGPAPLRPQEEAPPPPAAGSQAPAGAEGCTDAALVSAAWEWLKEHGGVSEMPWRRLPTRVGVAALRQHIEDLLSRLEEVAEEGAGGGEGDARHHHQAP